MPNDLLTSMDRGKTKITNSFIFIENLEKNLALAGDEF